MKKTKMEIEKWILKNLKELDKNFPDSINLQDSFSDYGMTSAQSIIMIERLKDFLDKEININDLWRYSTIEGFIDSLCEVRLEDVYRDEKIDINSLENAENEEYAIIGMGCRFPDADNIEEFWENLLKGRDSISKRKFDKKELAGGFINNPDMFDNMFFRISPREAENMDPQQRHLLEVTWETFEDANIKPEEYYGREVGVFVGICGNDYSNDLFATSNITDIYSITGNSYAIASNRLSYFYNFTGPSMSLDTACSSSLVATHYACMSLKNNDCEMALVGGVNLILNDSITDIFTESKMLSPDYKCKTFDEKANGYVRGEGIGTVLIKKKETAIRDGNRIYATILGSAVNQDGRSNGLTAPNVSSQINLVKKAMKRAKIKTNDIQYVEAHGTGTNLGDPIELAGLGESICHEKKNKLKIGSVKTNIGHLEGAAGIASLIKVSLCLYNKKLVPSLNFLELNHKVTTNKNKFEVQTKVEHWEGRERRIAGISSFGFGGTNAHLIIADYKENPTKETKEWEHAGCVLPLSAKSKESLEINERRALAYIENHKESIYEIAASYGKYRTKFKEKKAYVFQSTEPLDYKVIKQTDDGEEKTIAFVFSGQGPGKFNFSCELNKNPFFYEKILEIDRLFMEMSGWSIYDVLNNKSEKNFEDTDVAQPVTFGVQVATAYVLEKYGIKPSVIVGHSLGEVAAAYISGKLSLKDAIIVVYKRSLVMQQLKGKGRMLSVHLPSNEVEHILEEQKVSESVNISVVNSSTSCVISGPEKELNCVLEYLRTMEVPCTMLGVLYPFHGVEAKKIQGEIKNELKKIRIRPHKIDVFSTVTAQIADGRTFGSDYWMEQVYKPVQFYKTMNEVIDRGCNFIVEINTQAILMPFLSQDFPKSEVVSALQKNVSPLYSIAALVAKLYTAHVEIHWDQYYSGNFNNVKVPSYGWNKKHYWYKKSNINKSRSFIQVNIHDELTKNTDIRSAEVSGNNFVKSLLGEHLRLEISEMKSSDKLVELGMDSLIAYAIKSKVKSTCGCDIPLTLMIDDMSVGDMELYIANHSLVETMEEEIDLEPAVSEMQMLLWTIYQADKNNCAYNQNFVGDIHGNLHIGILKSVIRQLVSDHSELRAKFYEEKGILKKSFCSIDELEYFIYDEEIVYSDKEIELKIKEFENTPFYLENGGLFKVYLLRKRKGYVMTACAHHAVIDLESMNVLLSQLAENYQRLYNGLELESFTESKYEKFINDYTKYLDSENGTKDRDFWNEKLMGALPIVDLSVKKRPEKVTYNGDVFRSCISGNANWEINELAKKLNVTPFNILITAYYILMYKYTSENDIIIGMSATLRNDFGCENTVGDFINLLPIRTKVRSDMTFAEFSIVVKREILSALEHQKFSFKKILENINTAGTQGFSPVVQVAFSQENLNVEDNKNLSGFVTGHHANFSFSEISLSARGSEILYTPYDLLLMADTSGQNVNLAWQYNTDILNKEFIENMTLHYENILKAVLDNSDVKIKHIKMLTQVEYNKLFHEFNEVHGDEYDNRMFIDAFEEIVDKFGHHIAVSMNNERETYGSFNEKANQIGRYLQSMGAKKGDCVALCLNKSIKTMEVLIAILKIGCVYVPMDPEYPMNRINYILTETKANIVFAEDNWKQKGVGCPDCKIVTIKNLEENMNRFSHENIHIKIFPNDLAYIIFTSGTTGKPKGVMIEHIGICNMVKGLNEGWGVRKDSKVLQFASLSFDASIAEIFIALLSGGELVLKSKNEIMPGGDLERVLVEEEITEVILTPSVLMLTNPKKISKLRTVLSAGESCNKAVVEKWGSGRRFVNAYGPTESTVCASYKLCDPSDAENITIGKAILGTKLYILDNDLNPVPIGMPGELCISSIGLARGYFNRPDITDEKFVHNTIDKNAFNKIYRTSDIARFTKDGYIKFCGRKDNQVKIRGFRIEIDEVENILNKCDGVKEAAVIIKEFFNDKKLVAFVCGSDSCNEGSLRKQMKSELPHYMVPSYFEFVDELPHSISGKIDKKIVETFDILAKDIYVDDSLYTDTQKRLRKIWCKVLGNEDITLNSDFYESGGHSLSGAQAKIEIEKEFGVSLDIVDILEISKFIDLCNRIEEKSRESINNIKVMTSYKEKNYIPVTYAQNQLLFIWQLNNNSTEYNISGDVELKGELDVERFKEAYRNIVHLNHSLRTIFFKENNKYYQKICDDISKYELEMIEDCSKEKLDIYVDELKNWRFDLLNGPLVKSRLMRIGKNRYVLAFAVHHIISDGWSVALMVNMWSKEYNRLKTENTGNEEHKYQFSDYAIWSSEYIQGKRLEKLENYWIRKLKGTEDRVLDLVTDYKRPKLHTSKGEIWRHELDRELTKAIQKTASDNHGTLFMVLFAAFNVLLNKLTRKNDFNIGIPVAGRNLPETQNMLGMFINTIVMRTKIHDSDSFQELMRRVKEETLANLDNQDMPFERLVELLNPKRDMSYSPLFQILFNMLNIEKPIFNLNDIKTNSTKQTSGNSKYDMTIYISDGEKICFEFLYNRNLFSKEHIKLIASQYERILLQISKNDMICIEDIDIHEEDYLEEKVAEKVDTENIAELLRNSFLENDNKLAICSPQNTVNYHELDRMVKKYAAYLQSVVNDEWVYIYGDRNIKFIIIILACVFSGKSFAMIDSKYPINRIKNMIDSIQNKILIDASDEKNLLNRISDEYKEILFSDEVKNEFEYIPTKKDSHYIIFTSGTTGKPKAIKSKVSSVLHFIKWYVDKFELTDMDKFSMLSGLSHDPIMRDIFTPLLLGASLYIPSEEVMSVPGKMNEWLNSNKISIIHQTPSILKMLSDIMLETVRLLCLGGEGLYDYHLKKISSLFKKSKVVNVYGTSETPQVMAFYEVRGNEQGIVPIGKGIDGVKVFVADKKCKPVGRMGIGEIIVQTKYLSEGYITGLNSKEGFTYVSGERAYRTGDLGYVDMNNNVVLLAREDEQIKNRGYRIEPSEIEREILSISYIKEAKVLLCDDKLTAFLVESSPNVWSISEIKQKLLDVLPVYMVPELYIKVDTIPLTENGKVDNRALKEMKQHNTKETIHKVSPEGSIQEIVGRIWKELLNIEDIGVEDNFFDIGGHSFMLLELNERLQKVLDCNFEMVDLFQYPTIKLFSEYIESKKTDDFVIFFRQTDTNRKKEALRNKRMKRGKIKT